MSRAAYIVTRVEGRVGGEVVELADEKATFNVQRSNAQC
ncbi:MAG: hypothetical protein QOG67_3849 [Verrucomicrobiota bacterium]|jgi:hypothetical protein